MTGLVVLVPSRERPASAEKLVNAFEKTVTCSDTELCFVVDEDDPTASGYSDLVGRLSGKVSLMRPPSHSMVEALNKGAYLATLASRYIGFMGDDHRPRTEGWDEAYVEALQALGTGIVFGDDLLQGVNLPTQCAMTADIVQELGWMAPPTLTHLAVDNWWLELGRGADCLRYLPDVVVEHMHPIAGKNVWDDGYVRVNATAMYEKDLGEFERLRAVELPGAVEKVRALRTVAA